MDVAIGVLNIFSALFIEPLLVEHEWSGRDYIISHPRK